MSQPSPESRPGEECQPGDQLPINCSGLESLQVFEDRNTLGNPQYPPVKLPRQLPHDMRPHRPAHEG